MGLKWQEENISMQAKLQGWNSLSSPREDSKQVVPKWITEVWCEILYRPFSSDIGLQEESEHRKHCQPPVLDLLHLEDRGLVRIVREAQRVERASWVKLVLQILQVEIEYVCITSFGSKLTLSDFEVKFMYQAIGDSVVLCASKENDLGNHCDDKVDGDVLSEVVQCVAI